MQYDPKNYRRDVKRLGKRLFKMAHEWSYNCPNTIKERESQVAACKCRKKFATKKALIEATKSMEIIARSMIESRLANRSRPWSLSSPTQKRSLPAGTLAERAKLRRQRLILDAAHGQIESYSGDTTTTIHYGEPDASTATGYGDKYSRSCQYTKTDASHHITVATDWFTSVHLRGLARVDGLLTLDAEPVDAEGYTVYRASWLRSKGKQLSAEHGYIAIGEHGAAHAKTESGAKSILTRRANEIKYSRHERKIRTALHEMRLNGYAQIIVSIGDSIAAGNCRAGTEQFRDRHFPGRTTATIEEVLSAESMRGLAINACLRAIRRAKIDHTSTS